jgi:hypothetical protein
MRLAQEDFPFYDTVYDGTRMILEPFPSPGLWEKEQEDDDDARIWILMDIVLLKRRLFTALISTTTPNDHNTPNWTDVHVSFSVLEIPQTLICTVFVVTLVVWAERLVS